MANVYIFGSSESGLVKIGYSRSPERRLAALQGGHPFKLQIMRTWSHPKAYAIEAEVKRSLKPLQTYGEWFAVGLQAAIEAVEQAVATVEARPATTEMEDGSRDEIEEQPPEPGSLQHDQLERAAKIEEIEAEMECRMTRQQVFNLELSGVFGERWAEVRRGQGRIIR
jgi:hypothetical protein